MIDEEEIQVSRNTIKKLIEEGLIAKPSPGFVEFFFEKAKTSLLTAQSLLKLSGENKFKLAFGLSYSFETFMWVINSAYYSMFYAATSLLAKFNHQIKTDQGIHALTYHALIYYFLDNDQKLTRHILEQYQNAEKEASELLQIADRKAKDHIINVKLELSKRREFTYETGKIAEESKAKTFIKRAEEFLTMVRELMK